MEKRKLTIHVLLVFILIYLTFKAYDSVDTILMALSPEDYIDMESDQEEWQNQLITGEVLTYLAAYTPFVLLLGVTVYVSVEALKLLKATRKPRYY